jgi:3-phosphoshikimate 1-carboxyvinyltransferase
MTLQHLERSKVMIWSKDDSYFIPGGQSYRASEYTVPGDWSAAAFLQAAAFVTGSDVKVSGLDTADAQGDKAFSSILESLDSGNDRTVDLGDTPDLLPALAVAACFGRGTTKIVNVAHARAKESDRISAMAAELGKMGAHIEELPDGLIVRNSRLKGAELDGQGDHRIAMALAVAALGAEGETKISGAHAISKSYPKFVSDLAGLGADMKAAD